MSKMVERVALALAEHDGKVLDDISGGVRYRSLARAAIEGMRQPTFAAVDALACSIGSYPEAYLAYQAMIDAALSVSDENPKGEDRNGLSAVGIPARPDVVGDALPLSSHGEEKKGGGE